MVRKAELAAGGLSIIAGASWTASGVRGIKAGWENFQKVRESNVGKKEDDQQSTGEALTFLAVSSLETVLGLATLAVGGVVVKNSFDQENQQEEVNDMLLEETVQ